MGNRGEENVGYVREVRTHGNMCCGSVWMEKKRELVGEFEADFRGGRTVVEGVRGKKREERKKIGQRWKEAEGEWKCVRRVW